MSGKDAGADASRRMHEYLLAQQRRKEEYWLRKYGKVIQPPPPSLGKPAREPNTAHAQEQHVNTFLPPIQQHHGARARHGQPPMFHAREPVKNYFGRNAAQDQRRQDQQQQQQPGMLPPISTNHRKPPEPFRKNPSPQPYPDGAQGPPQGTDDQYGAAHSDAQGGAGMEQQQQQDGWAQGGGQDGGYANDGDAYGAQRGHDMQVRGLPAYMLKACALRRQPVHGTPSTASPPCPALCM